MTGLPASAVHRLLLVGAGAGSADAAALHRLLEVDVGHPRERPQRTLEVRVDQLTGRVVDRGDRSAVRAREEAEMRDVVGAAGLPRQAAPSSGCPRCARRPS